MRRAAFAAPAWSLPETLAPAALLLMLVLDMPITVVVRHIAMSMTVVVFEIDRVVMPVGVDPLIEIGLPLHDAIGRTLAIFFDVGPRIEVEMVVELSIGSADRQNTELRGEGAVVDVRRAPEITARGQVTELHHPGVSPDVIRLLTAVVVGDVVLPEVRRHAIEECEALRSRIETQDFDHATRRGRRIKICGGPLHVVVRVDGRKAMSLGVFVIAR